MTINVITTTAEGEQSGKNSKNWEGSFPLSARPLWGRCHFWALSVSPCLSAGSAGWVSQHLPAASAQALRATRTHALGRSRGRQGAPGLTAAKSLDLAPTQLPPDLLVLFVKRFLRGLLWVRTRCKADPRLLLDPLSAKAQGQPDLKTEVAPQIKAMLARTPRPASSGPQARRCG